MGSIHLQALYHAPRESLADLCTALATLHNTPRPDSRLYPKSLIQYLENCGREIRKNHTTGLLQKQVIDEVHIMPVTAMQILSRTNPAMNRSDLSDLAEQRYAHQGDAYRFNMSILPRMPDQRQQDTTQPLLIEFSYNRGHSLEIIYFSEKLEEATPTQQQNLIQKMLQNQQQMATYTCNLFQDIFYPKDKQNELLPPTKIIIRGWNIQPIESTADILQHVQNIKYKKE